MSGKKYAIERVEMLIKCEEEKLEKCQRNIKTYSMEVVCEQAKAEVATSNIAGLKDAHHKLRGLDNLEKKNKIADSAEMAEHQILRKGPTRTQLKWKDVEDMEIRRFIKDFLLPEITQLLMDRQYTFHEQLKEALK